MIESILNSTSIPLLEKSAMFAERRHEVLAGNVANIDTPGYKTRDLPVEDFEQALKDAVAARNAPPSPGRPAAGRQAGAESLERFFPEDLFQAAQARPQNLTFPDGNNRSIEHEMMEMTKNSGRHRFAVEMISAQMQLLETVINERLV